MNLNFLVSLCFDELKIEWDWMYQVSLHILFVCLFCFFFSIVNLLLLDCSVIVCQLNKTSLISTPAEIGYFHIQPTKSLTVFFLLALVFRLFAIKWYYLTREIGSGILRLTTPLNSLVFFCLALLFDTIC